MASADVLLHDAHDDNVAGKRNEPGAKRARDGPERTRCPAERRIPHWRHSIMESVMHAAASSGRGDDPFPARRGGGESMSSGRVGSSRSCRMYQSVFASARQTTVTSRRTPATSWAHQTGKVSLSPYVNRIAVRRRAVEQVVGEIGGEPGIDVPRRVAARQLSATGTAASSEDHRRQPSNRRRDGRRGAPHQDRARPIPAHRPHTTKLTTKK